MDIHISQYRILINIILFSVIALVVTQPAFAQGGSWETKSPIPTARQGPAIGVINDKLYVASGCCLLTGGRYAYVDAYDPTTDSWSIHAPIPTAIYVPAFGVINGKLYVAGGQAVLPEHNVNYLQVYDPVTDTWDIKTSMPADSAAAASGVINGKLYVAGGSNPANTAYVNTLLVYDPATDAWSSTLAPMPAPRAAAASSVINDILYVVGGFDSSNQPSTTVEAYDPATNTWTTKAPMPTARTYVSAAAINGILYAVGGYDSSNQQLATVEAYDPATNTWTTEVPMPTARQWPGVGTVNSKLYAVGGWDGSGFTGTLEVFTPGPDIEVEPLAVDFGDVEAFTSSDMIVTISNSGGTDLTVDEISLSGDPSFSATPLLSSPDPVIVLAPGEVVDVTATFFPTDANGVVKQATITISSDDPNEGIVEVSLIGNGLEGAVEDQSTVLEAAIDEAITAGTLVGDGSGNSANGRLNAFANMVDAAGDLIEAGYIEDACGQLKSALRRVDGNPRPPDFVTGEDAALIADQIEFLRESLGCN